jgi:carbonic anhydrase
VSILDELQASNDQFADQFDLGDLPIPPGRQLAVVTCMDARLDPARFLGLEPGDAHVIRNAGGVVSDDALRSLVISHHLLGTKQAVVIGHTDCGMLTFSNDELRARLGPESEGIDFLPFPDLAGRVRESVSAIWESPLLPDDFAAAGYIYDVKSGRLEPV